MNKTPVHYICELVETCPIACPHSVPHLPILESPGMCDEKHALCGNDNETPCLCVPVSRPQSANKKSPYRRTVWAQLNHCIVQMAILILYGCPGDSMTYGFIADMTAGDPADRVSVKAALGSLNSLSDYLPEENALFGLPRINTKFRANSRKAERTSWPRK